MGPVCSKGSWDAGVGNGIVGLRCGSTNILESVREENYGRRLCAFNDKWDFVKSCEGLHATPFKICTICQYSIQMLALYYYLNNLNGCSPSSFLLPVRPNPQQYL